MKRRVQRGIAKVDPRLMLTQGDGELFEGPAITVAYYRFEEREEARWILHDESIPDAEQRTHIAALFHLLEDRRLPVK